MTTVRTNYIDDPHSFMYVRSMCAASILILVTACGGGSGSSPAVNAAQPLQVRVALGIEVSKLCLDENSDFSCGRSEPFASLEDDGNYSIQASKSQSGFLLAETAGGERFAAPLKDGMVVGAISTLVVGKIRGSDQLTVVEAEAAVARALKLNEDIKLQELKRNIDANPEWQRLEDVAQKALIRGWKTANEKAIAPVEAAQTLSVATLKSLGRYTRNGAVLLATITERTVGSETALALNDAVCQAPTTVPKLWINTKQAKPVLDKEMEISADMYFEGAAEHEDDLIIKTSIKGRGNLTWLLDKKPYKLKLKEKASLLGMPSVSKHWVLLANHLDKSFLKNSAAFCLSKKMDLAWGPADRPVELFLNGEHQGLYSLVEHVREGEGRVEIDWAEENATNPDPNNGFFVEMDWRLGEEFWFFTPVGHYYTVKTDSSKEERDVISAQIFEFERRLYDRDNLDYISQLTDKLDVEAFVDYYLINELMMNFDAYALSTFAFKKANGKIQFGPVWDFDLAAGWNNQNPKSWFLVDKKPTFAPAGLNSYVAELLEHPEMRAHMFARMNYLQIKIPSLNQYLTESAIVVQDAEFKNSQKWYPIEAVEGKYSQKVGDLRNWFVVRGAWMLGQMEAGSFRSN